MQNVAESLIFYLSREFYIYIYLKNPLFSPYCVSCNGRVCILNAPSALQVPINKLVSLILYFFISIIVMKVKRQTGAK